MAEKTSDEEITEYLREFRDRIAHERALRDWLDAEGRYLVVESIGNEFEVTGVQRVLRKGGGVRGLPMEIAESARSPSLHDAIRAAQHLLDAEVARHEERSK